MQKDFGDEEDVDEDVAKIDEKTIKVSVDDDPTSVNNFNLHPITVAALKKDRNCFKFKWPRWDGAEWERY